MSNIQTNGVNGERACSGYCDGGMSNSEALFEEFFTPWLERLDKDVSRGADDVQQICHEMRGRTQYLGARCDETSNKMNKLETELQRLSSQLGNHIEPANHRAEITKLVDEINKFSAKVKTEQREARNRVCALEQKLAQELDLMKKQNEELAQHLKQERAKSAELEQQVEELKPKLSNKKSILEYGLEVFPTSAKPKVPPNSAAKLGCNTDGGQYKMQKDFTVSVSYVDEFNKQDRLKPIISDVITALSKELKPLRGQGVVAYDFMPQSASDELRKDAHLVILLGMKTTERIRMIERRVYGELGKFFCTDSVDRRYVLLATTGMPSTQNVMGLDNDEVREKIPSDQMIRHNMSTLFMSGADSKNLKSCDMNATAIYDVCKWMLDVTSKL
ncbi:hypothetical protein SeLEV6574_g06624 [Synchytrium endobioticum]|uniref:Uncharacterized protein n=1 Tax=Synchytrium endobioticum TaxID=286115 RepID=A0A507CFX4_9FUNG|nr:hypothetical protein SeLEV6574_g06624 [Synchytrium endobioticum]